MNKTLCITRDHRIHGFGLLKIFSFNRDGTTEWYCPNCDKHFIGKGFEPNEIKK